MPNVPPTTDDQISEHVPWEHLTIAPPKDRRLLIYSLAGALIVAVLGVVTIRNLASPAASDLQPVTPVTIATESAPVEPITTGVKATVPPPTVTVALAEPDAPTELSEADLMAVDTDDIRRQVSGRAEWLVLEFFTLDPSDPWRDRVEIASGLRLPSTLSPDIPDAPTVSYVEWTRSRSVEQIGDELFRASVLIRRLVASDGVTFDRLPTEWVEVHLRIEPDGTVRAVSLPEIIAPSGGNLVPLEDEEMAWVEDAAGIGWPATRP